MSRGITRHSLGGFRELSDVWSALVCGWAIEWMDGWANSDLSGLVRVARRSTRNTANEYFGVLDGVEL